MRVSSHILPQGISKKEPIRKTHVVVSCGGIVGITQNCLTTLPIPGCGSSPVSASCLRLWGCPCRNPRLLSHSRNPARCQVPLPSRWTSPWSQWCRSTSGETETDTFISTTTMDSIQRLALQNFHERKNLFLLFFCKKTLRQSQSFSVLNNNPT